jgi:hypothetical protein
MEMNNDSLDGFRLCPAEEPAAIRQGMSETWIRVIHPLHFMFEINIKNLIQLIELNGISKDGVLNGKYIFGWKKVTMWLIPENI